MKKTVIKTIKDVVTTKIISLFFVAIVFFIKIITVELVLVTSVRVFLYTLLYLILFYEILLFLSLNEVKYCCGIYFYFFFESFVFGYFELKSCFWDVCLYTLAIALFFSITMILSRIDFSKKRECIRLMIGFVIFNFWCYMDFLSTDLLLISSFLLYWYAYAGYNIFYSLFAIFCHLANEFFLNGFCFIVYYLMELNFFLRKIQLKFLNKLALNSCLTFFIWVFIYFYKSLFFCVIVNVILNILLLSNVSYVFLLNSGAAINIFIKFFPMKKTRRLLFLITFMAKQEESEHLKNIMLHNITVFHNIIQAMVRFFFDLTQNYSNYLKENEFAETYILSLLRDIIFEINNMALNNQFDCLIIVSKLNALKKTCDVKNELYETIVYFMYNIQTEIDKILVRETADMIYLHQNELINSSSQLIFIRNYHWYLNINKPIIGFYNI